jgi:hypothetical protein
MKDSHDHHHRIQPRIQPARQRCQEIRPDRVIDFSGNYEDYLASQGCRVKTASA